MDITLSHIYTTTTIDVLFKKELFILVLSFIKGTIKKINSIPKKEYTVSILAFKIEENRVPNIG